LSRIVEGTETGNAALSGAIMAAGTCQTHFIRRKIVLPKRRISVIHADASAVFAAALEQNPIIA
jgi:hypothetical protein